MLIGWSSNPSWHSPVVRSHVDAAPLCSMKRVVPIVIDRDSDCAATVAVDTGSCALPTGSSFVVIEYVAVNVPAGGASSRGIRQYFGDRKFQAERPFQRLYYSKL